MCSPKKTSFNIEYTALSRLKVLDILFVDLGLEEPFVSRHRPLQILSRASLRLDTKEDALYKRERGRNDSWERHPCPKKRIDSFNSFSRLVRVS